MDRLEYNILLEETGIYSKRKIEKDKVINSESDFIYEESATHDTYEIVPNDLTTEEIKIALLARQTKELTQMHSSLAWITFILIISFLIVLFLLLPAIL